MKKAYKKLTEEELKRFKEYRERKAAEKKKEVIKSGITNYVEIYKKEIDNGYKVKWLDLKVFGEKEETYRKYFLKYAEIASEKGKGFQI